jgi:serine phosphatase RsbU (regulator of sigma subunit)
MVSPREIGRPVNLSFALMVVAAIAGVAYADFIVQTISLGYLYLLPLAMCGFVFRLRISLILVLLCFLLQDWLGPFTHYGWEHFARNLATLAAFVTVVFVVDRLTGQRRQLSQLVRQQRDELTREIETAALVQRRLLPSRAPAIDGFDIAGRMVAARTVGGDYFDYLELPAGHLGLAIADVSGKGVSAALLMSSVKMALRAGAPRALSPDRSLRNLNSSFYEVTEADRYVTLFYGNLDTAQGLLEYTNAGHLPPLLFHRATGEIEWLETGGTVIGLFPAAEYQCGQAWLQPGDILILYTDGVTEATNAAGEEFAIERLAETLRQSFTDSAKQLLESIYCAVHAFRGTSVLEDDLTLVVVRALERPNLP